MIAVFLVEENDAVVPRVDRGRMPSSLGDEEAVSFGEGLGGAIYGEVNSAGDDELPLTVMSMFWDIHG